jgi:tetratricopeptide (TPR) repeat protein
MPDLHEIEQFKNQILSLGNEASVMERWGESIPPLQPPEEQEDEELSALLAGDEEAEEEGEEPEEAAPVPEEPAPEEPEAEEAEAEEAEAEEPEAAEAEEPAPEEPEPEEAEAEEAAPEEPEAEEPVSEEAEWEPEGAAEEEEFGDIEDLEGLEDFELPEEFEAEEGSGAEAEEEPGGGEAEPEEEPAEAEEAPEAEEAEEAGPGEEDFELPEDFAFPGEEEEELGEAEGGEEGEEFEEDFALPEDFDFAEEGGEEEAAAGAEEEFGEFETPEEGEEEEFGLPEFGEEELGGGEELGGEESFEEEEFEAEEFGEEAFGEEEFGEEELGEEPEGEAPAEEEGEEELGELEFSEDELGSEDFEVDEFSLDDLGEEFGALDESEHEEFAEEEPGEAAPGAPSAEGAAAPAEEIAAAGEEEELELSEDDFFALRNTLLTLPLNLKLRVEELIGEEGLAGENLRSLTDALVRGKSPKEIADLVSKITGEKIEIPSQYEKKTGEEFEREKGTFGYLLRYSILPMARTLLIGVALLALVSYLGYRFVYQPVYAYYLYNLGYDRLEERDYSQANNYFDRAVEHWVMKDQFFRYARGYREQQQWVLAEEKYEQLLDHFPLDKQGTLEYARMETEVLANYEKAERLLNNFLDENFREYEALLLLGDTYLAWGREDATKYEQARLAYATLMEEYGVLNELLFRMLSYFIRTDNQEEVLRLKNRFQADPELEVDPRVYAELGGYLIDKERLEDVRDILLRAKEVEESLPEIHYQLARYFKRIEEYGEERKALNNTLLYLDRITPLSRERLAMKIDTYRRLGERRYAEQQYLQARTAYQRGINLYENARQRKLLEKRKEFGRLYADLGDLHYYRAGEYDQALGYFLTAEENLYTSRELKYKKGFVYYRNGEYRQARVAFQGAAGTFSDNPELMYATANTWFRLGKYHSADGYYTHLLDTLKQELAEERPLRIDDEDAHRELVADLMHTSNNLGVTYYELYRKTGRSDYYSKALVQLSDSSEYFDRLTRDPETLERAGLSNLGYLNQRGILFPDTSYEQQIYPEIPLDMRGPVNVEN